MKKIKGEGVKNTGTCVSVDVTRIVKYTATAGVLIVGIIFGTRAYMEILAQRKRDTDI